MKATLVIVVLALGAVLLLSACSDEEQVATDSPTASGAASTTPSPQPSNANIEPTLTIGPTPTATRVSTYTDASFGYSFDYPVAWYLSPPTTKGGDVILYSYDPNAVPPEQRGMPVPKDKLKVFFWVAEGVDKPLDEWLAEGDNSPGQASPPVVISQSNTTVAGRSAIARVTSANGELHASYYVALGGGLVFVINAGPADSTVWPQFESVLATVGFGS